MKVNFITNSLKTNHSCSSLGDKVNELLNSKNPFYDKVWFIFGVSRESGLLYIKDSLDLSILNGSLVNFVISIDSKNITYNYLQELIKTDAKVWIYNNNKTTFIQNPRICIFESKDLNAEVLITSADFTEEGLSTNFETSINISFDIDEKEYIEFKSSISQYIKPDKKIYKLLTSKIIEKLKSNNELMSDKLDSITKLPSINEIRKGYRKNPELEDIQDMQDSNYINSIGNVNSSSQHIVIDKTDDKELQDEISIDISSNINFCNDD